MNVIRDEEMGGIMMFPIFCDWKIRRCNLKGCRNKPTSIITGTPSPRPFGMCEEHYQKGVKAGKVSLIIEFDDYDAFKSESATV